MCKVHADTQGRLCICLYFFEEKVLASQPHERCQVVIGSYRPIALTSTIAKLVERLIHRRLYWWLEDNQKLTAVQAGFRKRRCTTDQIARVCQHVHDGFQEKAPAQRTIAILFDYRRAYDTVWKRGVTAKLLQLGMPTCAIRWIQGFLTDRRARVKLGEALSNYHLFAEGLPQGSVLSPLLFTCYINDLPDCLPSGCEASLYADDLAATVRDSNVDRCVEKAQAVVDAVARWSEQWRMTLAPGKCSTTLFTTHSGEAKKELPVILGNDTLPTERYPVFLGVRLDRILSFTEHAKEVSKRAKNRCSILSALTGTTWGLPWQDLRNLYTGYIRPVLEYAGGAWMPGACATAIAYLDSAQLSAARVITGCTRDTRGDVLQREAHLQPMKIRGELLALQLRERALRAPPDNPLRQVAEEVAPRKRDGTLRLQVRSWREPAEAAARAASLDEWPREEERTVPPVPPWTDVTTDDIITFGTRLSVPTARADPPEARREAALATLAGLPAPGTDIWTDGAAEEGVHNGGAGVLLISESARTELSLPAGRFTSSFRAEMLAIKAALDLCVTRQRDNTLVPPVRLCSDSLSALQWVPGHAGLEGNEQVDGLAKAGCQEDQTAAPIDYAAAKTHAARWSLARWHGAHREAATGTTSTSLAWHTEATAGNLPRPLPGSESRYHQRIIHQLRAGKSPILAAYLHNIGRIPSPLCPSCQLEPETVRHLLLECPAHALPRLRRWGLAPTAEDVFKDIPGLLDFLQKVGRI